MPVRTGDAVWQGDLRGGKGSVSLGSGAYQGAYSFSSRFEQGTGTNPEELIAAAHAACFSMALAGRLAGAGHVPERVHTKASVHIEKVGDSFGITKIELATEVSVPGLDAQAFQAHADAAKSGCPVSKALAAVPISLDAKLVAS
ncbi:MAG TPA: OsmC family protein [Candidatus Tumulicola sp.]|nr:OsmC family protein [Candidatus Tumulicola sp.]